MEEPPKKGNSTHRNRLRAAVYVLLAGVAAVVAYDRFSNDSLDLGRAFHVFREETPPSQLPITTWLPADVEPAPLPPGTSLVRDDGGALAVIVAYFDLQYTNSLGPIFGDLFKKVPVDVEFQVVCSNGLARDLFNSNWGANEVARGRKLTVLVANRSLTMWARDRHLALQGPLGQTRVSLVPRIKSTDDRTRVDEMAVPRMRFEAGLVDRIGFIPYYLEGGNVVSNGRQVFVGRNLIAENEEVADEEQVTSELEALFGRDLVLMGARFGGVPFDHLDMYLTPVDNETMLLADLAQGAELLVSQSGRKPLASVQYDPLKQRQLRDMAAALESMGYKVERLPAVMHSHEGWLMTYNNVIMERRSNGAGTEKVVYMPRYNLPQLDKAAAGVYQRLGFRVETIDASKIFRQGGTVRCVANVALRRPLGGLTRSTAVIPQGSKGM